MTMSHLDQKPFMIEPLKEGQWQAYRDLWLEALQETPEAFFADYEDQKEQPDEVWQRRFEAVQEAKDIIVIFAQSDDGPVGFLGAYIDENPKFNHIATIWGAYVHADFRKRGIAKRMMEEFLVEIKKRPHITKIKTYSVTSELMAVNAYKNFGFELIGISKDEMKVGDRYLNVYLMEKKIIPADAK